MEWVLIYIPITALSHYMCMLHTEISYGIFHTTILGWFSIWYWYCISRRPWLPATLYDIDNETLKQTSHVIDARVSHSTPTRKGTEVKDIGLNDTSACASSLSRVILKSVCSRNGAFWENEYNFEENMCSSIEGTIKKEDDIQK